MKMLPRYISLLLVSISVGNDFAVGATTLTVTNTSGDHNVPGSLPACIYQANYGPADFYSIKFNIPGAGPYTISMQETIFVAQQMSIDATTQPGYSGTPLVTLNGNGLSSAIYIGPLVSGGQNNVNTVRGLRIINFSSNAITISSGSNGNWILNNWLGFTYDSVQGKWVKNSDYGYPNTRGIGIQSSYNVIKENVISGVDNGITIGEDISTSTLSTPKYVTNDIESNYIGTDYSGLYAFGNTSDAIFLGAGAGYTWIGPGNVLSGNASSGMEMLHSTNTGNVVFSNMIGVGKDGVTPIPNGELGILVSNGATYNAIGSWGGNVISCNTLGGIAVGLTSTGSGTTTKAAYTLWIQNNFIGTSRSGVGLGGQGVGVTIQGGSQGISVSANVIAGNIQHGIGMYDSSYNSASYNWIGVTPSGSNVPNGGYGVYLQNSWNNWIQGNAYGSNRLGSSGVNGGGGNSF